MFHRTAWLIRDTRESGRPRLWNEIGAAVIDPMTGLNRFLTGDASRVVEKIYGSPAGGKYRLEMITTGAKRLPVASLTLTPPRVSGKTTHLGAVLACHPQGTLARMIFATNLRPDQDLGPAISLRAQLEARAGRYPDAMHDIDRYLALSDLPFEAPEVRRA